MSSSGYYRFPTIHQNTIVFVSEDDLWTVSAQGGVARRLTSNLGAISHPVFSPDGSTLAFTAREEGPAEVFTMPSVGGQFKRITYLGVSSQAVAWTPDGENILFVTDSGQARDRTFVVKAVSKNGGLPFDWNIGEAKSVSLTSRNRAVIGRNNDDPARWKRYRGGTSGDLWIDKKGEGQFERLLTLTGNLARPLWIGERIYFLSDHEGIGNLYSCNPNGNDLKQLTFHRDYYVRFPSTDGAKITYSAGADLFVFDPETSQTQRVEIEYYSPRVQRERKFVDASKYLEKANLHPKGHSIAVNVRGKSFAFSNFEGAVSQQGRNDLPIRSRSTHWLSDGKRVVTVTDEPGEDTLAIYDLNERTEPFLLANQDLGRIRWMIVSPKNDHIVLANHRNQLIFVDLGLQTTRVIEDNPYLSIAGADWSPDGNWVAFGAAISRLTTAIKLWNRETGEVVQITEPVLGDYEPSFDPDGKLLYFLGKRELHATYDNLHFELGFAKGIRPYALTLQANAPNPFVPVAKPLVEAEASKEDSKEEKKDESENPEGESANEETAGEEKTEETGKEAPKSDKPIVIDLEGISKRVVAFPVPDGVYLQAEGIKGKVLLLTELPDQAAQGEGEHKPKTKLETYDLKENKFDTIATGISSFQLSLDKKTMLLRTGKRLRVIPAGSKPDDKSGETPGKKSGWLDLSRVKFALDPALEWKQMARETWRLQRDYFWTPDMSQIDWVAVWNRYAPLIDRVNTRGEYSDLMWEMQGELGTSHAYEMGGDYRKEPAYPIGMLGADYSFDSVSGQYLFSHIVLGAPGEEKASSPLNDPGVNVKIGDRLLAINGRKLTPEIVPQEALLNLAGEEVSLTVQTGEEPAREITVRTLKSEFPARYREWVETNRNYVHEKTGGRVGYLHIPDMGAHGFAEFHRLFLAESFREGLIVDVRYNRGGHVSQLLLEKLARKVVGYDISRWGQPETYPSYAIVGPTVALTNQNAGSDGDIFSHTFKMMKLGTLIGKRTWGGVIGISPRNPLADGSMTTQPEFSFWFEDVGWGVENYGTDPDIDVEIAPQDYAAGKDPQMEKALEVILQQLAENPPVHPDFSVRPNLSLPK